MALVASPFSIDSTTISLCLSLFNWANFRKKRGGIKLHTVLSHENQIPNFIHMTEAKVNDMKALWDIPLNSGTVYILDRAYLCMKWLNSVVLEGSHFVMRLKKNTLFRIVKRNPIRDSDRRKGIKADHIIQFTGTKKDEYNRPLRRIKYRDSDSGRVFDFITDRFDLAPLTIASIYKDRWAIELFFKSIKQNLRIKRFIGRSQNAVLIQVWTAMISLLLFEWAKFLGRVHIGLTEFLSLIRPHLFSSKRIEEILNRTDFKKSRLRNKNIKLQPTLF